MRPLKDSDDPLQSGWLPPRPPDNKPEPARGSWPPPPRPSTGPSSPALVFAIALGALSLLLLAASAGLMFFLTLLLSALALLVATQLRTAILAGRPGRETQARAAVIVAWIGVGLSVLAGVAWVVLWANGYTADDLRQALEELRQNRS
jgi:hypothetical protein